jgi:hypothetical protein
MPTEIREHRLNVPRLVVMKVCDQHQVAPIPLADVTDFEIKRFEQARKNPDVITAKCN